ncbi:MAG: hypothetical protein WCI73_17530, partial [Phycisphaerae bacterium]
EYQEANGKHDAAGMEFHCNARGYRIMEAFHAAWPRLRPLVWAAMREERGKKRRKAKARHDPSPKLALAQEHLTDWQRRQKAATNRVRKYLRQVRYYQGRLAARSGLSSN